MLLLGGTRAIPQFGDCCSNRAAGFSDYSDIQRRDRVIISTHSEATSK